jgi:lysophospholipase L1-like esterase
MSWISLKGNYKFKKIKIIIGFLAVSFVLFVTLLLIMEALYRPFYKNGFITASLVDPYLHHSRRPLTSAARTWGTDNAFSNHINNLGFRDFEARIVKKKIENKTKRLLFLGDSFTEGVGVEFKKTFPEIIKDNLTISGIPIESLNGGTSSFSPILLFQRLKLFFDRGYQTDMVILLPDFSDVQDELIYMERLGSLDNNGLRRFKGLQYDPWILWAINNSALIRLAYESELIRGLYRAITNKNTLEGLPLRTVSKNIKMNNKVLSSEKMLSLSEEERTKFRWMWPYHNQSQKGWAKDGLNSMSDNIIKIVKLCKERNIPILIVSYPHPIHLYLQNNKKLYKIIKHRFPEIFAQREKIFGKKVEPKKSLYKKVIYDAALSQDVPYIDLQPSFANRSDWPYLFIPNDIHFNEKGMEHMASVLSPIIREVINNTPDL